MARIELDVKFIKESHYDRPGYGYRNSYETVWVYKFQDSDGKIYVWKTTNILMRDEMDGDYHIMYTKDRSEVIPNVGALIKIRASVKGESEYKGEKQTVLTRVKVVEIIENAISEEEKREAYKLSQIKSLKEGDFIWKKMPYRQYKNHYSDCEKIIDSYDVENGTIDVIIRDGRLKNSGVRGQLYYYWIFKDDTKELVRTIKAVSYENAYKRVTENSPDREWNLDHFEIVSHR